MTEAFVIDGIRTPIGSFGGSLSNTRCDDLAALVIRRLIERSLLRLLRACMEWQPQGHHRRMRCKEAEDEDGCAGCT